MITKIKSINEIEKLPKGQRLITSSEVEDSICNNFKAFKSLKPNNYYKIINPNEIVRFLWLGSLDGNSRVDGYNRYLNFDGWVRGVLICKK